MENVFGKHISILDIAKERISEPEEKAIKTLLIDMQREKKKRKWKQKQLTKHLRNVGQFQKVYHTYSHNIWEKRENKIEKILLK